MRMNEYELEGTELDQRERTSARAETIDQRPAQKRRDTNRDTHVGIEQVLSAARARLRRLSPEASYEAVAQSEAILVDISPEGQRAIESSIAGALVIERNVLEWRFDPSSNARLLVATDHDIEVIVFCSEAYASSLAAASLQEVGIWRATGIIGGFHAWQELGLPIVPPVRPS